MCKLSAKSRQCKCTFTDLHSALKTQRSQQLVVYYDLYALKQQIETIFDVTLPKLRKTTVADVFVIVFRQCRRVLNFTTFWQSKDKFSTLYDRYQKVRQFGKLKRDSFLVPDIRSGKNLTFKIICKGVSRNFNFSNTIYLDVLCFS